VIFELLSNKFIVHLLVIKPNVNELPMVFVVLTPKINGMGNELAMFANEFFYGSLLQVLQLFKNRK